MVLGWESCSYGVVRVGFVVKSVEILLLVCLALSVALGFHSFHFTIFSCIFYSSFLSL